MIVGETIVLFVNDSVPAKVAIVPVVGKVIFVTPVVVNVVLKLPAVVKSLAVKTLPPKVIVLPELFTPVPPNCPAIACVKFAVPSNALPYKVLELANFVAVLALPDNSADIVVALKLPLPSLLTKVLGVLFGVAAAIVTSICAIVDELTPPILLDEAVILVLTNAVVAICVLLVPSAGVGAVGIPVKVGDAKFAFKSNADCVAVLIGLFKSLVLSTFVILELILVESPKILARKTAAVSNKDLFKVVESAFIFAAEYRPSATQFELSKLVAFNL